MQLGTNNVAPFLFTKLLHPILAKTARTSPVDSVRVVWVSSEGAGPLSPKGGVLLDDMECYDKSAWFKSNASKAGNVFHANELAKCAQGEAIIGVV